MPQSKKMKVTGQKQQPWESSNVKKSNIFVKFEWHYIWHKINIVFHEKKIIQTAKHCAGSLMVPGTWMS